MLRAALYVVMVIVCLVAVVGLVAGAHYGVAHYEKISAAMSDSKTTNPSSVSVSASAKAADGSDIATASAVTFVEKSAGAIGAGREVSNQIDQLSKVESANGKPSVTVRQNISMCGGKAAIEHEVQAGKIKVAEVMAKAPRAPVMPASLPTIKVDVSGHVVMDGTVNNTGTVAHSGAIAHSGTVAQTGTVKHEGIVISKGEIKINGVTRTVTVRERYDGCGRLIDRQIVE